MVREDLAQGAEMSYIVKRTNQSGRVGYTGPMRTLAHAQREAAAWNDAEMWRAKVVEYTPAVKAEVRAWQKAKKEQAR